MNAPVHPVTPGLSVAPLGDAAAWDAYVAGHADATPFHSRAWCEAITKATGHTCHVLAARDASGAIAGLLPLHLIRSLLFGQARILDGDEPVRQALKARPPEGPLRRGGQNRCQMPLAHLLEDPQRIGWQDT